MCLYKQHGLVSRVDTRCSFLQSYSLSCQLSALLSQKPQGFNLSHVTATSTSAVAAEHPRLSFQTLLPNCHKSSCLRHGAISIRHRDTRSQPSCVFHRLHSEPAKVRVVWTKRHPLESPALREPPTLEQLWPGMLGQGAWRERGARLSLSSRSLTEGMRSWWKTLKRSGDRSI